MKLTLVLIIGSAAAFAQPISYGLKGGLPLTDFIDTVSGSRTTVSSVTNRYIVGPTFELRLPFGFGVEVDALYRHFSYNSTASLVDVLSTLRTTSNDWEFPLLLKKRFGGVGPVHPFVDAGVSFNKISGLSQSLSTLVFPNPLPPPPKNHPGGRKNPLPKGLKMGGGGVVGFVAVAPNARKPHHQRGKQQINRIPPGGGPRGLRGKPPPTPKTGGVWWGLRFTLGYASNLSITRPDTSVSRKSRPWNLKVSLV